ncbi:MAG TPA: caspase family protein [Hyphomicrobiales bacterium]|nr:caspase family protein [Hyphomicrobiales bacterium]
MRRGAFAGVGGLLLAAILFLCASVLPAMAEKRIALVIGNGAYRNLRALANPPNDGADVAAALRNHGFEVLSGLDVDRAGMAKLMDRFVDEARDANVALFYYAGHGVQIGGRNYLIPVDAAIRSADEIASQAIAMQSFLARLAPLPAVKLVFLDACRNNPAPGVTGGGLAREEADAAGFLIAFATQPGNVAYDGGGRNSPFAQAFLSHLGTRGQDLSDMMIAVRKDVVAATGGAQVPWENSSLIKQFYFEPGSSVLLTAETQLWQLAGSTRDPALLRIYVDRYGDGPHAADARSLLAGGQTVALSAAGSERRDGAGAAPAGDAQAMLWQVARNARVKALVDYYLARYPDGRFAAEAHELAASLAGADVAGGASDVTCARLATHPGDATATDPGVPIAILKGNADAAIAACRAAAAAHPETGHYTALLARAMAAAGRWGEAVPLYRKAAAQGDLRAMVSLATLLENGDHVGKDVRAALALYERAAAAGSADAALNLAADLEQGIGGRRDVKRALALLHRAAGDGSALATYDLGVLAVQGVGGGPAEALEHFRKAADLGEPRGYLAIALLLDAGGGGAKADPAGAAAALLKGVALDNGEALAQLAQPHYRWAAGTLSELQTRLQRLGYFKGRVDGRPSERLVAALKAYRLRGDLGPVAEAGGR